MKCHGEVEGVMERQGRDMKDGLKKLYLPVRGEIVSRLDEFERIWETGEVFR